MYNRDTKTVMDPAVDEESPLLGERHQERGYCIQNVQQEDGIPCPPPCGGPAPRRENSDVASSGRVNNTARKCPVTVEPALLLFSFYSSSSRDSFAQYLYFRIRNMKNITETTNKNESLFCSLNQSDPTFKSLEDIQKETSMLLIYYALAMMIPAFVSTVVIGGYSDQGGRRIALICPVIGSLVRLYLSIFVIKYDLPVAVFIVAGVLEGCFGSVAMYCLAIYSYISDITTEEQRSFRVVILVIMFGGGGMLGHYFTGYMIRFLGYNGVQFVNLIVATANLLIIFFLVPETIKNAAEQPFWTTKHLTRVLAVCFRSSNRRGPLLTLMAVMSLGCLSMLGRHDMVMLYMMNEPLCWDPILIGQYKASYLLITSVGGLILTRILQPKVGDLILLLIALISAAASDVLFAISRTKTMMFLVPVVGVASLLPLGLSRAALSKLVAKDETGALFSWVAWIELLGSLLGNLIFNAIYKGSYSWFNGFAFVVNAILLTVAGILVSVLMVWKYVK